VVQQSTLYPEIKGSNLATGTGREKMAEESWVVVDQKFKKDNRFGPLGPYSHHFIFFVNHK
jgi:hypothetical protein